jgi:uncharacterized repeat protein (TIGR01451 family)
MKTRSLNVLIILALFFAAQPVLAQTPRPKQPQSWQAQLVDGAVGSGRENGLILPANKPAIAYYDNANKDLKYTYQESNGQWVTTIVDQAGDVGRYLSIDYSSSQDGFPPIISYYDATQGALKVAAWQPTIGWSIETVDDSGSSGQFTSLVYDRGRDEVHISYYDSENKSLKYARRDSGGWFVSVLDSVSELGEITDTAIAVDSNGHPHIVYGTIESGYRLWYAGSNGSTWSFESLPSAEGYYISFRFDAQDNPHIISTWSTFDIISCAYGYVKYTTKVGGVWQVQQVDGGEYFVMGSSLAIDSSGKLHAAYDQIIPLDCGNGYSKVQYAELNGSLWAKTQVTSSTEFGSIPSLSLDSLGNASISYYDDLNQKLMFASNNQSQNLVADLAVNTFSDSPDPVNVGSELAYQVSIQNNGPAAASGITMQLSLPAGVTFKSASSGCSYAAGKVTCSLGSLSVNASGTLSIVVFAPTASGSITTNVQISGNETDPNLSNNSASISTQVSTLPQGKAWTFLLYLAGDSGKIDGGTVHYSMARAIQLLEQGSNPDVQVVALMDGPGTLDTFRVTFSPQANYQPLGEKRMDDPSTLVEFVQQAQQEFPAQHYYLAIADHANGIQGIAWDTTTSSTNNAYLTPGEIRQALTAITNNGTHPIDILHFDGCSFGILENAYIARGLARYVVASENIGFSVFAYDAYRSQVNAGATPTSLARNIAQEYARQVTRQEYPFTISVLDLSRIEAVTNALKQLSISLISYANASQSNRSLLTNVRNQSQKFDSGGQPHLSITNDDFYIDLVDFTLRLKQQINAGGIPEAANSLLGTLQGDQPFVVFNSLRSGTFDYYGETRTWNLDGAHGISIYYPPRTGGAIFSDYTTGITFPGFNNDSQWANYLLAGVPPLVPGDPLPEDGPDPLAPLDIQSKGFIFIPVMFR